MIVTTLYIYINSEFFLIKTLNAETYKPINLPTSYDFIERTLYAYLFLYDISHS